MTRPYLPRRVSLREGVNSMALKSPTSQGPAESKARKRERCHLRVTQQDYGERRGSLGIRRAIEFFHRYQWYSEVSWRYFGHSAVRATAQEATVSVPRRQKPADSPSLIPVMPSVISCVSGNWSLRHRQVLSSRRNCETVFLVYGLAGVQVSWYKPLPYHELQEVLERQVSLVKHLVLSPRVNPHEKVPLAPRTACLWTLPCTMKRGLLVVCECFLSVPLMTFVCKVISFCVPGHLAIGEHYTLDEITGDENII